MTTAAQAFAALARLEPKEALDYLKQRGEITQSWSWVDLWGAEHAQAFTISRLTQVDLLKDIQAMITASVNGEMGRRDFMRDAKKALQDKGWWGEKEVIHPVTGEALKTTFNPARLQLIFDVNTRQAYAAGQWERMQASKRSHPYIRYVTMGDGLVRKTHAVWSNVTLPVDDAFWHTHFPPNGYRCRCRVVSVSQREYDKGKTPTGEDMLKTAPPTQWKEWVNPSTGASVQVPEGVHPAFSYNVGIAAERAKQMANLITEKMTAMPEPLAVKVAQALAKSPGFEAWFANPQGHSWPLVRVSQVDAEAIGSRLTVAQLSPDTVRKQALIHPELTAAEYALAQEVVANANFKVLEGESSMIYVLQQANESTGGYVLIVKATKTGEGLFVTSYRRLSRDAANSDAEVARLLEKGNKK